VRLVEVEEDRGPREVLAPTRLLLRRTLHRPTGVVRRVAWGAEQGGREPARCRRDIRRPEQPAAEHRRNPPRMAERVCELRPSALTSHSHGHREAPQGERIGVLICGGNTTAVDFAR